MPAKGQASSKMKTESLAIQRKGERFKSYIRQILENTVDGA